MEARCYIGGAGRTHLIRLRARPGDVLAVVLVLLLAVALVTAAQLNLDLHLWHWLFKGT
jgi:energy-coupling factor transporter transmembrane protein EcfT